MSALETLDRFLKELERKMRLAAWTRGVAVAAFCALIATTGANRQSNLGDHAVETAPAH